MDYEEKEKNVYGLFYSDGENLRKSLKNIKRRLQRWKIFSCENQ